MKQYLVEFKYISRACYFETGDDGSLIVAAKSPYDAHVKVQIATSEQTRFGEITNVTEIKPPVK